MYGWAATTLYRVDNCFFLPPALPDIDLDMKLKVREQRPIDSEDFALQVSA